MTSIYNITRIGLLTIFILTFSACSVKYSFTGASIPQEAKTISVAPFPNMAMLVNPLLSNTLTEALKDRFMRQTSLQLVPTNGDLSFTGTITDYRTSPMAIQAGTDKAAQNRLSITIKVQYKNAFNEKANYDVSFTQYKDYDSSLSLDDVESALATEIVELLVEDVFNKAVVNW